MPPVQRPVTLATTPEGHFLNAPAKIPATIVTGFLGAGKTTLIRNLIARARGRRIAIIVNEFGEMGFDGSLLADCGDDDCRPDSIVELTNGCICCTVADEFIPTIEALLARDPAPDHIVIETSGLALPQPLVRAFAWPNVRHRVTVDGVVTVVDAPALSEGRFTAAADAGRSHDDPVEELFEDQLRCADLVVVGKADLMSPQALDEVEAIIARETRPGTQHLRSSPAGLAARAPPRPDGDGRGRHGRTREPPRPRGRGARPRRFHQLRGRDTGFRLAGRTASAASPMRWRGRACCASRGAPPSPASRPRRSSRRSARGSRPISRPAIAAGLVVIGLRDLDRDDIAGRLAG